MNVKITYVTISETGKKKKTNYIDTIEDHSKNPNHRQIVFEQKLKNNSKNRVLSIEQVELIE